MAEKSWLHQPPEQNTVALRMAFELIMEREKGFYDDPAGGPTKYGVSLRAHREEIGDRNHDGKIDAKDVMLLELPDAMELFREHYWTPAGCDGLPAPLALLVVDFAYNSGVRRAVQELQVCLNVKADGVCGPTTTAVAWREWNARLAVDYCARRLLFMQGLRNWPENRLGWTRRVLGMLVDATSPALNPA